MLPDFFVIGAQKAGSTYLLQCLGEHPQIFMPPSEVAFFEDGLYDREQMDRFERHFDPATPEQVVGVKRPNLLGLPEVPQRLQQHMPNLKLVVVLRHPVQRAVSGYFHYMKTGFLPLLPIEEGMPRLLSRELQDSDLYPRAGDVLEFGLYHKHLTHYQKFFPAEKTHIILLDDVRRDAQEELRRTYEFLGVDTGFQPPSVSSRPMGASYSILRLRLWNAVDRHCRVWSEDRRYFHRRGGLVGTAARKLNAGLDQHVWRRLFSASAPKLSQALESELTDFYRSDVQLLQGLLGHSTQNWRGFS